MVSKKMDGLNLGSRTPLTSPTTATAASLSSPTTPKGMNEYRRTIGSVTPVTSPTTGSGSRTPTTTTTACPGDSRIPRPSPTALRRSSSMRLRGERGYHSNFRATGASPASSIPIQQYHQRHNSHSIHCQNELFPAITENGVDSPRHRTLSLSLTPARPRSSQAARESFLADDSDVESVKSYGSACSTASACDHAHFALNGTTWSGRSRKYVVHCSNHADDPEYLTPTQRAARQIRKLQANLNDAKKIINDKENEILRLTKEVVELRLYKASLGSPDDKTDSSDALTVRENNQLSPETPSNDLPDETTDCPHKSDKIINDGVINESSSSTTNNDLTISLADSGHFDDDSNHSKDSNIEIINSSSNTDDNYEFKKFKNIIIQTDLTNIDLDKLCDDVRRSIVDHYENRIEEMHRRHVDELQELKQKHNDKVESLLTQLSEINTKFLEIRPSMDAAEAKVTELESQLEATRTELTEQKTLFDEQEERNKQMYLKMYSKGQEAARLEQADQIFEHASQNPPKVTVAELMQQLSVTQIELENIKAMYRRIVESRNQGTLDPEITLQFLKSAIYYFLTDKENHHGHLNAIESILGFTDNEKLNIEKVYGTKK